MSEDKISVTALFSHPVSGIHHVTVKEVESVEKFRADLKGLGCSVVFVEEIKLD